MARVYCHRNVHVHGFWVLSALWKEVMAERGEEHDAEPA